MTPSFKILAILALVVASILGFMGWKAHLEHAAYERGLHDGEEKVTALWNAANAKAIAERAAEAAKFAKEKEDAIQQASAREQALRADVARVAAQRDGLRNDLAASRAAIATASVEALRKRVAALTDVFESCVDEYRGVAEKADRHAADALMFDKAWPTP